MDFKICIVIQVEKSRIPMGWEETKDVTPLLLQQEVHASRGCLKLDSSLLNVKTKPQFGCKEENAGRDF